MITCQELWWDLLYLTVELTTKVSAVFFPSLLGSSSQKVAPQKFNQALKPNSLCEIYVSVVGCRSGRSCLSPGPCFPQFWESTRLHLARSLNSTGERRWGYWSQCPRTLVGGAVCVCARFLFSGACVFACTYRSLLFMQTNQRRSVHMCTQNIWFCIACRNFAFLSIAITYRQREGEKMPCEHTHTHTVNFLSFSFLPES